MSSFEQSDPMARVIATARDFFDTIEYYMDIATRLQRLLHQQSLCGGCYFEGAGAVYVYIAPLPDNPFRQMGAYGNGHQLCVDAKWANKDGETWYHIVSVMDIYAELGQEVVSDPVLPGWVKGSSLGSILPDGCDDGLRYASEFDNVVDIPWNAYEGQDRIMFQHWPIPPQLICGESQPIPLSAGQLSTGDFAGIHGIGVAEPNEQAGYPKGLHHGVDFFAPQAEADIPVVSVDYGVVTGIGITGVTNSQVTYANTPSSEGEGYAVIVRYGNLYVTYGHLSKIGDIWVGKEVYPGEFIGILGLEGQRHLHFEVRSYGSDTLSEIPTIDPVVGTIDTGVSASSSVAPYVYDPMQFLPSPIKVTQSMSGPQKPEETLLFEQNLLNQEFFNMVSTEYILTNGSKIAGTNIWTVDVPVSEDCVVRLAINLDPEITTLEGGYRGFQGYGQVGNPGPGSGGLTSPSAIPNFD